MVLVRPESKQVRQEISRRLLDLFPLHEDFLFESPLRAVMSFRSGLESGTQDQDRNYFYPGKPKNSFRYELFELVSFRFVDAQKTVVPTKRKEKTIRPNCKRANYAK